MTAKKKASKPEIEPGQQPEPIQQPEMQISSETDMLLRALVTIQRQVSQVEVKLLERMNNLELTINNSISEGIEELTPVQQKTPEVAKKPEEDKSKVTKKERPWYLQMGILLAVLLVLFMLWMIWQFLQSAGRIPFTNLRFK